MSWRLVESPGCCRTWKTKELPHPAINEEDQGPLLDLAFRLTEDQTEAVAIRVFAMTVVFNFCTLYPELKDELRGIIGLTIAEGATPGFRSRGGKILEELNRGVI